MNVHLTPQLERMVREKVESGLYDSESEVVCEALRLMEQKDSRREEKLEELRQEIRKGIESGESTPWDLEAFKKECRARRDARRTSAQEA
jgi:antitoxin ParD1/3/4